MLPRMRTMAQQAGDAAEDLVVSRLVAAGWAILGRQVRVGRAELDIVAVDPAGPTLVVVEVRWRSRRDFGLAEETVDRRKQGRLREAMFRLLESGRLPSGAAVAKLPIRLDIVGVDLDSLGRRTLRHHRGVGG